MSHLSVLTFIHTCLCHFRFEAISLFRNKHNSWHFFSQLKIGRPIFLTFQFITCSIFFSFVFTPNTFFSIEAGELINFNHFLLFVWCVCLLQIIKMVYNNSRDFIQNGRFHLKRMEIHSFHNIQRPSRNIWNGLKIKRINTKMREREFL